MARFRMLNPEFWLDEDLAKITPHARLLYMGLWGICDDNYATLPNRPEWIKAQVFPYESVNTILLLGELSESGKIILFLADNQEYWFIKNFFKYQRVEKPSKPKYPEFSEAKSINSRGVVGEESDTSLSEVKLSEVKLSEVILEQKAPAIKSPSKKNCTNPKGHPDCIESIDSIEASFKKKFPNYGKQIKAYHQILKAGFTFEQVAGCLNAMDRDKFWSANGWDLMDVANQLGRGGGKFVQL